MSQFKTKAFLKLKKTWYKKLEKSGFDEIEDVDSPKEMLKSWHSYKFNPNSSWLDQQIAAKRTYFENAAWFLDNHCFDTSLEKRIWACHAEGLSYRETAQKLKIKEGRIYRRLAKLKKVFNAK